MPHGKDMFMLGISPSYTFEPDIQYECIVNIGRISLLNGEFTGKKGNAAIAKYNHLPATHPIKKYNQLYSDSTIKALEEPDLPTKLELLQGINRILPEITMDAHLEMDAVVLAAESLFKMDGNTGAVDDL